ncbi:LamG-like jellyroll fold domain-containing protein [uncultured Polaribacter sp.]|uniref:LamG-like jellyroll fold domain-containing protein n=1 Tax=uncultured Polaribacter sp. TaxID=174711 RepID=UPI002608DCB2|nr:LamG-like jellyroll fold domain-containing protein [uncultured Polaribacter sp.]
MKKIKETSIIFFTYSNSITAQIPKNRNLKKLKYKLQVLLIFLFAFTSNAQTWETVGTAGFSAGNASYQSLGLDSSGTPYVAYKDTENSGKTTVMKFNGTSWETVGTAGFSAGGTLHQSLDFDSSGTPYVAYQDYGNSYKTTVMKFNGTSWETVGNAGFSAGHAYFQSLGLDSSGTPYVAYQDNGNSDKTTVMKFNGTSWETVGAAGLSVGAAYYQSLGFDSSGTPYVAYQDDGNNSKTTVMKFNGTSWETVGAAGFSAGAAPYPSLGFDSSGTPYVAYQDYGNSNKATVMKFNGTSWETVGNAGFSASIANYPSLDFDSSGTPYVAYQDYANSYKTTVMKFNGTSWETVGTAGFSAGWAFYQSLGFDSSGTPYVAYLDSGNSNKTTVMKFSPPATHLNFDGVNDIVDMGTSINTVLDGINTFTVEANVRTTTTAGLGIIVGNHDYPSINSGMQFLLRRDGANYVFWIDHGSGYTSVSAVGEVATNTWQHVSGTWDGTNMKIYVDGVLKNTKAETGASFRTLTTDKLTIGGNANNQSFNGDIDEVRIWSKVRTVAEILANKGQEISNTETGLLAYYQFNQGAGGANNSSIITLTDNSVNNYNGTLTNFALTGSTSNWLSGSPIKSKPTVTTTAASSIANTSATLAGNVTANGGDAVTDRGIVYSKTSDNANPEIGGASVTQDTNGTGTGVFTESITGLAAGTQYSFKAYAINASGTSYGAVATFTTLAITPTLTTTAASVIANTSATLAGNITSDGGASVTDRGIVYAKTSDNANPEIGGANVTQDTNGTGSGVFTEPITGLVAGTQYSFKAYAINASGTSYGAVATFTTTNVQTWQIVGTTGFSASNVNYQSLGLDSSGTPYVAYQDAGINSKTTVMKFNGTSWVTVGAARFSAGAATYQSLDFDSSGTPYVAYQDSGNNGKTTVMKFNGTSWVTVGAAGFSAGTALYQSLGLDSSGTPYVAYLDAGNSFKTTVMKFNGTSWETVGVAGFSAGIATFQSLGFDSSGTPYVAYQDGGNSNKTTVMKFNGTSWVTLGTAGFSTSTALYQSLGFDGSGTPYVAYKDAGNSNKTTVMKFNGTSWETVGVAGFSAGAATYQSLSFDSLGTPYVAFQDGGNSGKTTVMKFNGTSWLPVGIAGFSASIASYQSLGFDSSGTAYVAYQDGGNNNKTTVMKFLPPLSVTTTTASSIANTSVTLAGNVTADGGDAVTDRGIVYSKTSDNANPTIGGANVTQDTNGTGTGVFSESITGLVVGTQYSFNAYAINGQGTSYGTVATFTTTGKGWTGVTNTDWATASNWNPSSIPTASDNLVIPNVGNKPIISSSTGAIANNITIDASSSVTVESGGSLIIDGTATVNGSFIYNVNVADTNWHLVSSPVAGEQFDDTWNTANNINTNLPNEAVSTYINTSDADGDWVYFQNGGGATTFGSGIGYSMQRTGAGNYAFTGTFPAAPINPDITASNIGNANENKWTLVGNPFPAHVNIATFLAANTTPLTDTHESVYVWNANANGGAGEYQPLTTGQIHPGQGFFVNSNLASTSVTFTKAMQSDQNGVTFYRTSNPKITLIVNDGSKTKSTEINYLANKTTSLDPRFDVGTFTGQSSSFNLYTHLVSNSNGINFMRQALPDNNYENMIIPVGIDTQAGKEITFTTEAFNLPTGIKVFIEDKETNTFTRLDEANSSYKFTPTTALNEIGRFFIHTSQNALTVKDIALENVSIYKTNTNSIRIVGLQNSKTSVKLFNILGKQVLNTSFVANGIKDITLPKLATGVYVVQLQTDKGKLSKKIILE